MAQIEALVRTAPSAIDNKLQIKNKTPGSDKTITTEELKQD
jgi:hypothetical protein